MFFRFSLLSLSLSASLFSEIPIHSRERGEILNNLLLSSSREEQKFSSLLDSPFFKKNKEIYLDEIKIPFISFREINLNELIDYLRSQVLIYEQENNIHTGLNFVLQVSEEILEKKIDLKLHSISLKNLLLKICDLYGVRYFSEFHAIVISQESEERMIIKKIPVPADFLNLFSLSADRNSQVEKFRKLSIQKEFEKIGFAFPPSSSVSFFPSRSFLILRHYPSVISDIQNIISPWLIQENPQFRIKTKIFRVTGSELKELGFDWMLAPYPFFKKKGHKVSGGGRLESGYPSISPENLRNSPLFSNSLDSLLQSNSLSSNTGFIIWKQNSGFSWRVVIRALEQLGKRDFFSQPEIVTQSGKRALIYIGQEFPYPKEYSEPQIPDKVGNPESVLITPATPSNFEFKELGSFLVLDAVSSSQEDFIHIEVQPRMISFEGFIDYGSPISIGQDIFPNPIKQPIFETIASRTQLSIQDGKTFLIGGLLHSSLKDVEQAVPIFSKIPLLGKLFRSKIEKKEKEMIFIFINVKKIDILGNETQKKT